jgi:hypothetical protein
MTMTFRKLFVIAAAVAALGVAATGAFAQSAEQKAMVDRAKAEGIVGEQADGFRVSSSDPALNEAVQVINSGRRQAYARSAAEAGTTAAVAGAVMFETQLLPRITSGQWYRTNDGRWVQR